MLRTASTWRSARFPLESFKHIVDAGHVTPELEDAFIEAVRKCEDDPLGAAREWIVKNL